MIKIIGHIPCILISCTISYFIAKFMIFKVSDSLYECINDSLKTTSDLVIDEKKRINEVIKTINKMNGGSQND